jgi:hypothetical protein
MEDLQSTNHHLDNLQPSNSTITAMASNHEQRQRQLPRTNLAYNNYNSNYHALKQNKIVYYTLLVFHRERKVFGPIGLRGQMIIFILRFCQLFFLSAILVLFITFKSLLRDNNLLVTFVTTIFILS